MSVAEVRHVVTGRLDGPVAVLSDSLGSTLETWDAGVATLEEHFRVVRYDTRGHGRSPVAPGPHTTDSLADDLAGPLDRLRVAKAHLVGLLDRLGVAKAHLVGLSLRSMTALRVAARDPGRADRLAVLCTSARPGSVSSWTASAALVAPRRRTRSPRSSSNAGSPAPTRAAPLGGDGGRPAGGGVTTMPRWPSCCATAPRAIPHDATRDSRIWFPLCPQASEVRTTPGQHLCSLWTTRDHVTKESHS